MPFEWMHPRVPSQVTARGPVSRLRVAEQELQERAGLLARLGYDESTISQRLRSRIAWGYELRGDSPVSDARVAEIASAATHKSGGSRA
jgi:hypothetical protein